MVYQDHEGQDIEVGDCIRSLETNWNGKIVDTVEHNGDVLLECQGINHWTQELDDDDTQWFVPVDVFKANRVADPATEGVNAINMM